MRAKTLIGDTGGLSIYQLLIDHGSCMRLPVSQYLDIGLSCHEYSSSCYASPE